MQALPTGRRGQALAAAMTALAALLLWFGAVAPLADWYAARNAALAERMALAAHMQSLAARLPALRRAGGGRGAAPALLAGQTDALAAADLQERVGRLAAAAAITPTSLETLPSAPRGAWRRVGIRLSLAAPWPRLVALLAAITRAQPRMLIDEVELRGLPSHDTRQAEPVQASFAVYAFRAGAR